MFVVGHRWTKGGTEAKDEGRRMRDETDHGEDADRRSRPVIRFILHPSAFILLFDAALCASASRPGGAGSCSGEPEADGSPWCRTRARVRTKNRTGDGGWGARPGGEL